MMTARVAKLPVAGVVILLLAAAMAGCGSSATSSGSDSTSSGATSKSVTLAASVEAICARRNSTISAFNLKVESESRFKIVARQLAAAERATLAELTKLTAPAAVQAEWEQFLNHRQALIKAWDKVGKQGLYDGIPTSVNRKTNMTAVVIAQKQLFASAQHDGYKNCTQPD